MNITHNSASVFVAKTGNKFMAPYINPVIDWLIDQFKYTVLYQIGNWCLIFMKIWVKTYSHVISLRDKIFSIRDLRFRNISLTYFNFCKAEIRFLDL